MGWGRWRGEDGGGGEVDEGRGEGEKRGAEEKGV